MDSSEEYLIRALRRTINGLTDSLIPAHGAKLTKLMNRFETASSINGEVNALLGVQGFGKCALAMEWLLERNKRSADAFAPEQFESDVLLLNEKLFEAFLNQPFDMPDFSRSFEAPVRHTQQNVQLSADEFSASAFSSGDPFLESSPAAASESDFRNEQMSEPNWGSVPSQDQFGSTFQNSENTGDHFDSTPALSESMTPDLFESSERIAQTSLEFFDKQSGERPIAMAVLRVTVRAAVDSAKESGNVIVQDFLEAMLRLIAYADEQGKIRSDIFADTIRDIGDRLSGALKATSGGITLMKNLTAFISEPKELLSKK